MAQAVSAIAERGVEAVSVRSLAPAVGVTSAAITSAFGSRRGLLTAIAAEGYTALLDMIFANPRSAPALVYLRFASEHPGHFEVIRTHSVLDSDDLDLVSMRDRVVSLLVPEAVPNFHYKTREEAIRTWAVADGLAAMSRSSELLQNGFRLSVGQAVEIFLAYAGGECPGGGQVGRSDGSDAVADRDVIPGWSVGQVVQDTRQDPGTKGGPPR